MSCSSFVSRDFKQTRQSGRTVTFKLVQTWPSCGGSGINILFAKNYFDVLNFQFCINYMIQNQSICFKSSIKSIILPLFILFFLFYQTDMSSLSEKKWVEGMFQQVSVNLHQLLDSLTYIYESHGVQYAIKQYFGTLMRLLAPIQLLVNTIDDPIRQRVNHSQSDQKMQKKSKKKHHENESSSQNSQKQLQKMQKNVISLKEHPKKNINESRQQNFQDQYQLLQKINYFSQEQSQQEPQRKDKDNQIASFKNKKIRKSYRYGSNYSKTTLSEQEQIMLCQWIKKEMSKGTLITKQKIMEKAKKMSKIQGFQASSGWCRRFLYRNEDIRLAIEMNKFHPDIKRRKDEKSFNDSHEHEFKYWNQYNKQIDSFEEVKSYDLFQQPEENQGGQAQKRMEETSRNQQQLQQNMHRFEDKLKYHKKNLTDRNNKK